MFRYVSLAGNSFKTIKSSLIYTQLPKGITCSSANFASYGKKKGSFGDGVLRKNNNTSKAPPAAPSLLNPSTQKIVQYRQNATASSKPPECPPNPCPPNPCPPNPCPPPLPEGPKKTPPPNKNLLIALLVGALSLGGAYFFGLFEDEETRKSRPLLMEKNQLKKLKRKVPRNPLKKEDFPNKVPYVLIGGGTASFTAFRAIKSRDPKARVLVIASEDALPYMRPPLSKEIWGQSELPPQDKLIFKQWNGQERSLYYEPPEFYLNMSELETAPNGGVVVATGWVVSKVNPSGNTLEIEDPETNSTFCLEYEKCLIATGSRPKNLPVFEACHAELKSKLVLYRNIQDLKELWGRLENAQSVAIVGGGFLGSELACSLARKYLNTGRKVHQVFKESGNMGHVLPEYLSEWTTERVIEEGVNVIPRVEVLDAELTGKQVVLSLSNGKAVKADVVVVAVGSEANTQLAEPSELETDPNLGGFLVNAELEARSNLYVAGDAACFYDPILGRRRVEHHDHAVVSGRLAGENMVGAAKAYKHQSMFWSDLGPDVGYEAIGVVNSCLPTVAVFAAGATESNKTQRMNDGSESQSAAEGVPVTKNLVQDKTENTNSERADSSAKSEKDKVVAPEKSGQKEYNKGVIFYLKNDMVVGIVLWNVFNRMHIARQILAERRKYEDLNEVAKLFGLHEE